MCNPFPIIGQCCKLSASLIVAVYAYFKEKKQTQVFFALVTWIMLVSLYAELPETIKAPALLAFSYLYKGILLLHYIQWFGVDTICLTRNDLLAIKAATPSK